MTGLSLLPADPILLQLTSGPTLGHYTTGQLNVARCEKLVLERIYIFASGSPLHHQVVAYELREGADTVYTYFCDRCGEDGSTSRASSHSKTQPMRAVDIGRLVLGPPLVTDVRTNPPKDKTCPVNIYQKNIFHLPNQINLLHVLTAVRVVGVSNPHYELTSSNCHQFAQSCVMLVLLIAQGFPPFKLDEPPYKYEDFSQAHPEFDFFWEVPQSHPSIAAIVSQTIFAPQDKYKLFHGANSLKAAYLESV
jgi:hypothetical protein